jgi:glyoxylase-like metal-dependent hydrolase (beta-lactamase superfamily II)
MHGVDKRPGMMANAEPLAWSPVTRALVVVLAIGAAHGACPSRALGQPPVTPRWCERLPRAAYARLERVATTSQWFEVYRVDSGVYAIYEPHQWEEVISYLILGSERALLLDTGMGIGDMRALIRELTQLPIEVINTHTHGDHLGDNWEFEHILGLANPYTQSHVDGSTHAAEAFEVTPDALCGTLPVGFDTASYRVRPFHITDTVADGSVIDLGRRRLEVLEIPGHAPDAIALFDAEHGSLFTGDTFYEGPIYVFGQGSDFRAFTRSVDRLAALRPRVRTLFPAHNLPVSDPELLVRLRDAVHAIAAGTVRGTADSTVVTYDFGPFSLLVARRRSR